MSENNFSQKDDGTSMEMDHTSSFVRNTKHKLGRVLVYLFLQYTDADLNNALKDHNYLRSMSSHS